MNRVTRKQLVQYFIITFAFSWFFWLPGILIPNFPIPGKTLEILGALGPMLAALILTGRNEGRSGLKQVFASSFGARCNWKFLGAASLMLMALHYFARFIYGLFSDNLPQSEMLTSPINLIPLFILMFLLGGGLDEEIGWRGYALDRLQSKYSALVASLFLGAFWIVWHLPVFYLAGTNQSLLPFGLFILPVLPLGVMMTWVYNNTNQSIFAAAFFHTVGNLSHELFRIVPTADSPSTTGFVILTVLYYLATVLIIVIFGGKTLRKEGVR